MNVQVLGNHRIFSGSLAVLLTVVPCLAGAPACGDELPPLQLPPVAKKSWRFKKFPIIAWWGPPGTARLEDFRAYKEAGFTLYAANPDTGFEQAMDFARRIGLSVMAYRQRQGFELPAQPADFSKHSKQIVGWITHDEPGDLGAVRESITAVNTLMRQDPTRWALFNLLPPHAQHNPSTEEVIAAAVRDGMPLLSYDSYVIHADGSDNTEAHFRYLEQFRQASLKYQVPFWAFALSIQHFGYRRPSESDVRWNQFTNLAYGAKGLWYFTYWGPKNWENWDKTAIVDPKDGSKTALYEQVKSLNHTIAAMGQVLLGLTSTEVVHTTPPPGQRAFVPGAAWISNIAAKDALVGFFRDRAGKQFALVVNKQHGRGKSAQETADTIELSFGPGVHSVTAVNWLDGTPGPLHLVNGKASLPISGGTGVLLRLNH